MTQEATIDNLCKTVYRHHLQLEGETNKKIMLQGIYTNQS